MNDEDLFVPFPRTPLARTALAQLLKARFGSEMCHLDPWTVAVELSYLLESGFTITDLRLLVAAGYMEHAEEITESSHADRRFCAEPRMRFGVRSCLILTASGAAWVARMQEESDPGPSSPMASAGRQVPRWSEAARELRADGKVLKRFRRPAPCLELVLRAFEEDQWPRHLDDPLPPELGIDPQQRLRDVVRRLNACQSPQRIEFESDGRGTGLRWRWISSPDDVPRNGHG